MARGPVYSSAIYGRGADVQAERAAQGSEAFQLGYTGNPLTMGYLGYRGFGPSPYSFAFGPYGFGSYGMDTGNAYFGLDNPGQSRGLDELNAENYRPRRA